MAARRFSAVSTSAASIRAGHRGHRRPSAAARNCRGATPTCASKGQWSPSSRSSSCRAGARGVDVKLLLPGETDSWLVLHAGRAYYDELLRSGVKIFERRDKLLHSKTALIDGAWSTIGSTNLDWRSFVHNQELDAVILG